MSLKKFFTENKAAVLVGIGSVSALGLYILFGRDKKEEEEVPVQEEESIKLKFDPSVKVVSLYDRLGGEYAIGAMIDRLVDRMSMDKQLKKYFVKANLKNKKQKMTAYLKVAMGGPKTEDLNIDLKASHEKMNLTNEDFDLAKFHLRGTLEELAVDTKEIKDADDLLEQFRSLLVHQ